MTLAIWDSDGIVYKAGFVGETHTVEVKHIRSGKIKEFNNKTEFWGHWKKKSGGWLGETNAVRVEKGLAPFTVDEFQIEEKRVVTEDIANVLHTVKTMISSSMEATKTTDLVSYIAGPTPLKRLEQSTLMEYKGNRKDAIRPLLKDDIVDYIMKHQKGALANRGLESDDECIIRSVGEKKKGKKSVVITFDKDVKGCPVYFYNPDKPDEGVRNGDQFGELFITEKGEVDGIGRLWKYFQCIAGDSTDHYKANCFSDKKWGDKSSYEVLKDCKNDKEGFQAMYDVFCYLYPEKIEVEGWRGDLIQITPTYVFQEMWNMCHMRRWEDDVVDVKTILSKYKII